jgi:hypothetical protein
MANAVTGWLIVQADGGHCDILPADQLTPQPLEQVKTWGPFETKADAIARRVGLIRAGHCQPE